MVSAITKENLKDLLIGSVVAFLGFKGISGFMANMNSGDVPDINIWLLLPSIALVIIGMIIFTCAFDEDVVVR